MFTHENDIKHCISDSSNIIIIYQFHQHRLKYQRVLKSFCKNRNQFSLTNIHQRMFSSENRRDAAFTRNTSAGSGSKTQIRNKKKEEVESRRVSAFAKNTSAASGSRIQMKRKRKREAVRRRVSVFTKNMSVFLGAKLR